MENWKLFVTSALHLHRYILTQDAPAIICSNQLYRICSSGVTPKADQNCSNQWDSDQVHTVLTPTFFTIVTNWKINFPKKILRIRADN